MLLTCFVFFVAELLASKEGPSLSGLSCFRQISLFIVVFPVHCLERMVLLCHRTVCVPSLRPSILSLSLVSFLSASPLTSFPSFSISRFPPFFSPCSLFVLILCHLLLSLYIYSVFSIRLFHVHFSLSYHSPFPYSFLSFPLNFPTSFVSIILSFFPRSFLPFLSLHFLLPSFFPSLYS